jgi:probable rRNA maturation factor
MIFLQVSDALQEAEPALPQDLSYLEQAAEETLRQAGLQSEADLSLVLSDEAQLQALNRQYRGIDAPTDVLSFAADALDPDSGRRYLGDVIISYPRALLQATAGGHSLRDELTLLVVHGVLHLLGYDHLEEAEKAQMWALQDAILKRLGCSIVSPLT